MFDRPPPRHARRSASIALAGLLALSLGLAPGPARAQVRDPSVPPLPGDDTPVAKPMVDSGRLLATGGVSQVEGAAGGGLVPWALITGYGTRDSVGATAHDTQIFVRDYNLNSVGGAIGLFNRVELSYDHLWFDTQSTGRALGLGKGFTFEENVIGAKVRLTGDAVYDQDTWLPQLALGVQYKRTDDTAILKAVGARTNDGTDFYLAATKLFLRESLLVNVTVRGTRANQFGILGFGGTNNNDYHPEFETSAALLLSRDLAIGGEYRTKPSELAFARENNVYDWFLAYFFNKNVAATLAYVELGDIATRNNQNGVYLSLQVGF